MEQFRGQTRLPDFAVPRRYDLRLRPDLTACTFSGAADVLLEIRRETHFLALNSLDLAVDSASVVFAASSGAQLRPSEVAVWAEDEVVVLAFDGPIPAGDGVLSIGFSGVLNEGMKGFYRSRYVVNGEEKVMAVTQFASVDARRCFPCWDEPALKATFKITLVVPSGVTALSNMPAVEERIDGDVKTVCYEESPLMSTYLVAFVVGLFDVIEDVTSNGVKVSVYCPVGKSYQGKFGLEVAVKVLDLYKNYFATPYPLPKLDMVAIPDFAGAMENYGLITYQDAALLYDDLHSAAANKQWVAIVIAHEIAHQWFGNLVTMEWWAHVWLNEGFATWVSYLATDILFPEWKIWTQFVGETAAGLRLDSLAESHPIEVEVRLARSVDEIFDAISYKKGASIIRMLQSFLGADIFQRSLASYVKKYAFKNAKTEDLWCTLSEESGVEVNKLMNTWTKQKGYPVVSVKLKGNMLEFEQSQFCSNGSVGDGQWIVPLTLLFGLDKRTTNFMLESKNGNMSLGEFHPFGDRKNADVLEREQWWVIANFERRGFYRVKYDEKLAERLQKAVKACSLSTADRFGILDDCYALCEACEQPLSSLLSLMNAYKEELDYVVISRLINISIRVVKIVAAAMPDCLDELKTFIIQLLQFSADKLGWDPASGESHLSVLLREKLLTALVFLGHDATIKEASHRFHIFLDERDTPLLSADTRKAAYLAVMRNVNARNRSGFEFLLKLFKETDIGEEKIRLLGSMASCPDPDIVLDVLNFVLSSEVGGQYIMYAIFSISWEGREVAWSWLKENWDVISQKWSASFLLPTVIRFTVSPFFLEENAEEVEAFFASRVTPLISRTLKQSLEQVRINARWVQNIQQEQSLGLLIKELALVNI